MNHQELKSQLSYDPKTGLFKWKIRRGRALVNATAGNLDPKGYIRIRIYGRNYGAHRLAWLYLYGEFPSSHMDHINGDRSDNRISNLRLASPQQNARNRKISKSNKLGLKGVYWNNGWYLANIWVNGKSIFLGCFKNKKKAHLAYKAASQELFGEFARTS